MATGLITVTRADAFIPEVWSKEAQIAVERNLVAVKLINSQFENEVTEGDTLRIAQVSNLTARSKTAGTDVTFETFTESQITVTIATHSYAAFSLEDIVAVQANQDLRARYTDRIGYTLAQDMDATVLGLYSGLSQSVGVQGTDVTDANFRRAVQYLDDADAPAGERSALLVPAQMNAILALSRFTEAQIVGYNADNSPIVTGFLMGGEAAGPTVKGLWGRAYGVNVYMTTNIRTTGTSPLSYHNLLFHKDAFVIVRQMDVRVQAQYRIAGLTTEVVGDVLYGSAEYRDTFACRILT